MKQFKKKHIKKHNISLRRKIALFYTRCTIAIRIALGITLWLLCCTEYLSSVRNWIMYNIYDCTAELGFRLKEVVIEGQQNVQSADILKALNADEGKAIASIDLTKVQNALETNKWIKAAIIQRSLPHTIHIVIFERIAVAIWQNNKKLFLIDHEGYPITDDNIEDFTHLLHIVGTDANVYASQLLQDIARHHELSKKITSAVRYGERRWNLNLQNGITVKMPETDFNKAFDYLIRLYDAQKLFDQNYKILDLRDHSKYYIEKYS